MKTTLLAIALMSSFSSFANVYSEKLMAECGKLTLVEARIIESDPAGIPQDYTQFQVKNGSERLVIEQIAHEDHDIYQFYLKGELREIEASFEMNETMQGALVYRMDGEVCKSL